MSIPLSVRMSVCHAPSNCFFFQWNPAIFWPSVLHVALYKTLFFDFWFRPPNAQNLLPKIAQSVWQIDRRCLSLPGGFRGWPIQCNHAICCGADPCCHGNEIWTRRGDPVAYRLVSCSQSVLSVKILMWILQFHVIVGIVHRLQEECFAHRRLLQRRRYFTEWRWRRWDVNLPTSATDYWQSGTTLLSHTVTAYMPCIMLWKRYSVMSFSI